MGESHTFGGSTRLKIIICIKSGTLLGNIFGGILPRNRLPGSPGNPNKNMLKVSQNLTLFITQIVILLASSVSDGTVHHLPTSFARTRSSA